MKTITTETAQQTCAAWHGGQWSSLYQFASSGQYYLPNALRYLQEIEDCLHPEYALHPGTLSKKDERELNKLKLFFIGMGEADGLQFEYKTQPTYGYLIPYLLAEVPDDLAVMVTPLKYAI